MRVLRILVGAYALAPAALLAVVLGREAAAGRLPLPALERVALFGWLLAVILLAARSVAQAFARPRAGGAPDRSADGRSPPSTLILPDLEARVARIHRTLDAIEARGAAQLAEIQGRRPAEVAALAAFADRLARTASSSQGTPDAR